MKLPITPFLDSNGMVGQAADHTFRVGDHSGVIVAAAVGFSVYLVGLIASFWLPEPKREELPE